MLVFFLFCASICVYMFARAEIDSSVFYKLGFTEDDVPLDEIQLEQHYHFGHAH